MVQGPNKDINEFLDGLENEIKDKGAFDSKRESIENGLKNKGFDALGKLADHARVIWDYIMSPEVPWTEKVLPVAALAYFVMPFDVIPDFIPVFGYLDDIGVIAYTVSQLKTQLTAFSKGTLAEVEPSFLTKIWNGIKVYTDKFVIEHIQYPVTYEDAMKFFIDHKKDDSRIAKGAMLKYPQENKIEFVQVFLNKDNALVCQPDGVPYGRRVLTTGLDEELLTTFKDKDLVIVE